MTNPRLIFEFNFSKINPKINLRDLVGLILVMMLPASFCGQSHTCLTINSIISYISYMLDFREGDGVGESWLRLISKKRRRFAMVSIWACQHTLLTQNHRQYCRGSRIIRGNGMEWNMLLGLTASVLSGGTVNPTGPRPGGRI